MEMDLNHTATFTARVADINHRRGLLDQEYDQAVNEYLRNNPIQPGDKVWLTWKGGDQATVAVSGLVADNATGKITPQFRTVTQRDKLGKKVYRAERAYTMTLLEGSAFPELFPKGTQYVPAESNREE